MRLPAAASITYQASVLPRSGGESLAAGVVGMHLHREVAAGVEPFEEQREDGPRGMAAQQFMAPLTHQFAERHTRQRAGGHDALVNAAINEFPRLGEVVAGWQGASEACGKASAAPDVAAVEGSQ